MNLNKLIAKTFLFLPMGYLTSKILVNSVGIDVKIMLVILCIGFVLNVD